MLAIVADIHLFQQGLTLFALSAAPRICPCILLLQLNRGLQTIFTQRAFFVLLMGPCSCFVCLSSLCLNCDDYSHNLSVLCLIRNIYVYYRSRHLWNPIQIRLRAEVNKTSFESSLIVCSVFFLVLQFFSNFGWLQWSECLFAINIFDVLFFLM